MAKPTKEQLDRILGNSQQWAKLPYTPMQSPSGLGIDYLKNRYQEVTTPQPAKPMTKQEAMDFALMGGVTKVINNINKVPLSALEQTILEKSGDSALQRFQKAKALVPDLETQYTPKALQDLFTQTEKFGLTVMKPSEFENFASPLSSNVESIKKYSKKSLEDTDYSSYPEYMQYLKEVSQNTGFKEVPYLHLNKEETGLPLNPFISGHEGRHRTRAQSELGDVPTLIELRLRGDLYPSLPKENYIDALNKEMAYNPLIYPQPAYIGGKDVPRVPRKLPNEIFGAGLIPAGLLDEKKKPTKK
jgi:hypothetical protein